MKSLFKTVLLFTLFCNTCIFGYLNNIQLHYIKKIIGAKNVDEDIKIATTQVLIEHYTPFVRKMHKQFINQQAKKMDAKYKNELYHYATLGLLESLKTYDGTSSLDKYARKFIHGRLCRGMNEMAILQSIPFHNIKDHIRKLKPKLIPYDEYWKFEDMQLYKLTESTSISSDDILEILSTSPPGYMRLFYRRYDYKTLMVMRKISEICEMEGFSEETYRVKMNEIMEYIKERILYIDY